MKKKNQTSNINKYLLAGLTMVCVLLMFLSVFYVRAAGPFRVLANQIGRASCRERVWTWV